MKAYLIGFFLIACFSAMKLEAQSAEQGLLIKQQAESSEGAVRSTEYRLIGYSALSRYDVLEDWTIVDSMRAIFSGERDGNLEQWLYQIGGLSLPLLFVAEFKPDTIFTYEEEFFTHELNPKFIYLRYFDEEDKVNGYCFHNFELDAPIEFYLPDDSLYYNADNKLETYINGINLSPDSLLYLYKDKFTYESGQLAKTEHSIHIDFPDWHLIDTTIYEYEPESMTVTKYETEVISEQVFFLYDDLNRLTDYFLIGTDYPEGGLDTILYYKYYYDPAGEYFIDSFYYSDWDDMLRISESTWYYTDIAGVVQKSYHWNYTDDTISNLIDSAFYFYNDAGLLIRIDNYNRLVLGYPDYQLGTQRNYYYEPFEATAIDPVKNSFNLNLYPNPATDAIHVSFPSSGHGFTNITISGMDGRMIKKIQTATIAGMNEFRIDLSEAAFTNGSYLISILQNGQTYSQTFIIQK